MRTLAFRRPVRRRIVVAVDPRRCRCLVHHAVTPIERNLALARIDWANASGDSDLADFLRRQLDKAADCPAYQNGPTCPCGCGRRPSEHSEPMGAA